MLRWISSTLMCASLVLVSLSCSTRTEASEMDNQDPVVSHQEAVMPSDPVATSVPQEEEKPKPPAEAKGKKPAAHKVAAKTVPAVSRKPDRVSAMPQEEAKPAAPAGGETQEEFADNAFPPTVSDTPWHARAWQRNDCLRCHETGVGKAPEIVHQDMPMILKTAKCRSCHVAIPGQKPNWAAKAKAEKKLHGEGYAEFAFPPSIPASESHSKAWRKDDCRLCHDSGIGGAPKIVHETVPAIAVTGKCRTCHVQVRVIDALK